MVDFLDSLYNLVKTTNTKESTAFMPNIYTNAYSSQLFVP